MTQYLPPNLLALFAPREPIPYLPPTDKLPCEKIRRAPYAGVTPHLQTFEDPKDTPPPTRAETRQERLERKRKEKLEAHANRLEEKVSEWDPANDANASGDAYKTLFVARINYDTSESKLRREFEVYGPIRSIKMTKDVNTGKPRGYAFIEYEHERDMHSAYKHADGKKIDGRRVLVDVERGRTVKGWRPRRLGGGLGGTRKGGPEVNVKHSGREDPTREHIRERGERPERPERRRSRERSRDRGERRRSRDRSERGDRGDRAERGDRPERHRSRDTSKEPRRRSRSRDRERRRDRDRKRGGGGGEEEKPEGEEAGEVMNGEDGQENDGISSGGGKRERERDRDRDRKDRDRDRKKSRRDRDRDRDRRDRDRDRDRDRGRDKNRDRDRGGDADRAPEEEREQGEYGEVVIKQEPIDPDEVQEQQEEQVEGIPEDIAFYPPPPPPAEPEDGETMDY
ncbi:U1 small nuclear ribonucleoprotein 70 kDa-like isoform X2 [Branchiostoma floridae]|uniref:U1 small nuclear ribonucleoprotein 70 kDa n=1 Tax=Branchiostoma floridae TaxID=7739 RepID=A0A9J7KXP6_BRAFL|nr:U1 small nuclear ribonucleoprotein 70 kDa-like isoform X2 [Branchiostoma floridae]